MKRKYYSVVALSASSAIMLSATPALAQEAKTDKLNNENTESNAVIEKKDAATDVVKDKKDELLSIKEAVKVSDKSSFSKSESLPEVERTTAKEKDFLSHVYVSTESGVKTAVVKDAQISVQKVLEKEGIDTESLRSSTGERIDLNGVLENDATLVLFSDKIESVIEDVELEPSLEIIKDPTLEKGVREVLEEGEKGTAIKTTISKVSTSLDKEVNKNFKKAGEVKEILQKKDESLNITKAPKKRIVKIGTKEVVEAVGDAVAQARSAMDSATSDAVSQLSSFSSSSSALSSVDLSKVDGVRAKVVALAHAQIGKPYVWGAAGPSSFDCSGLVQWIFNDNLGYSVPRVAADQGSYSTPISIGELQPGDILWTSGHIGIYVGNGEMVHAPQPGDVVKLTNADWFINSGAQAGRLV